MVNLSKSWPRVSDGRVAWVTRLSLYFKELWVSLGIEKFIHITTVNTPPYVELMSVVLTLWSKSINYFLLPFDLISITFRDSTILVGLPIQGVDALCLLDV